MRRLARRGAFTLATSDRVESAVMALAPLRSLTFGRARRYVAGVDAEAALAVADGLEARGLKASLDQFGENTGDPVAADAVTDAYVELARRLQARPATTLSIDLSHVALDADSDRCLERVLRIAHALGPDRLLQVGAEESWRTERIVTAVLRCAEQGTPVMATVQANLRRSERDIERLAAAGVPVRLVKGAYVEAPADAHPWGAPADEAFLRLAARLAQLGTPHALATHDAQLRDRALALGATRSVEMLLGVRGDEASRLAAAGLEVRVYVPFGPRWFRYFARRVAESLGA